ncbi:DUF1707 and DUF4190 domain-containing protein [Nocardia sp. NPDC019395]|uniref:DUF1707 and DUF4190 domain-containing protein n=1 Tax=Nocardia sp. NPDC019395 TaxID=3154686 RepID=UPI0033C10F48
MEPQRAGGYLLMSDADREQAVAALKQSFQAGRLTADELSDRIGHVLSSRTAGDLDRAMAGLPWTRADNPAMAYTSSGYGRHAAPTPWQQRGLGFAAFVLGVFGFLCGITSIPAVVVGVVALTMDTERDDKGYAISGIAVGVIWLAIFGWKLVT